MTPVTAEDQLLIKTLQTGKDWTVDCQFPARQWNWHTLFDLVRCRRKKFTFASSSADEFLVLYFVANYNDDDDDDDDGMITIISSESNH